jgi:type IV pilus assembly protein PilA
MNVGNPKGFTLLELLIILFIIGVIGAVAIPRVLRARMSGNEASAIGSVRAVGSAQASYSSGAAQGGYAVTLVRLAAACPGGRQGFISADLRTDPSIKSGYRVALAAGRGSVVLAARDCNNAVNSTAFYVTAVPVRVGMTGSRGFASDTGGAVWQNKAAAGTAPPQPFVKTATISPIQ